ncbi:MULTISPECIES: type II toxin-antitoxin system HigB family toxin [unclassified Pseudocitrobacter]|uniref:type II toxin-antitoxin system HigB family toxin n=1 Tax=unclassified Pseudocitrobacter TaxID=2638778 RepID=UPI0023E3B6F1|nr:MULTISPECIES: type II toxin-antitoxin system HigB family toxin [unclassified Pseudocitrobacter]MDF3826958.1 type II toxin-antitoxin system HigB family toxin [Pseudocitrobacter sp. 2023EL-00150]MEC5372413.1 type II toxin-antitoxin system HigB family toxin [Pseudocitrobacter sp. MW920760]
MHVISRKPFNEAIENFPHCAQAIADLLSVLEKRSFNTPLEMREQLTSLDNFKYRNKWWVIDIAGNHLRLIAYIDFRLQKLFVKHIVTHLEYERLNHFYRGHKE